MYNNNMSCIIKFFDVVSHLENQSQLRVNSMAYFLNVASSIQNIIRKFTIWFLASLGKMSMIISICIPYHNQSSFILFP
jgi:hypothetical protein